MPNFRRYFVPGGTYFFTVVTAARRPIFASENARSLLGNVFRECQRDWPFDLHSIVLLPDHLHTIWILPENDDQYSARWSWIKREFTIRWLKAGGTEVPLSPGQRNENRRGVWQRRFWEHTVRDEDDFQTRFDYIHYNPVKHGHARCPSEWGASSFQRWVDAKVYAPDWGCSRTHPPPDFSSIEDECGEPDENVGEAAA